MQERVRIPERRDIEERLSTRSRSRDPRNVGELDGGGHVFAWIEERRQPIEPLVRNPRDSNVGFRFSTRAMRLTRAGEQLKERRLAGAGEADQGCTEHGVETGVSGGFCLD